MFVLLGAPTFLRNFVLDVLIIKKKTKKNSLETVYNILTFLAYIN